MRHSPTWETPSPASGRTRTRVRIGLVHGALLGLVLALGLWTPEGLRLADVPLRLFYATWLSSTLALVLIGAVAGVLSAPLHNAALSGLVWVGAALLIIWTLDVLLYEGRTWLVWLLDWRFWGQPIYMSSRVTWLRAGMAGFFVVLFLGAYGLLHDGRLDSLAAELTTHGWLTGRGWFTLMLGLAPALVVGIIANGIVLQPIFVAPRQVQQAIQLARTAPGDLFALSQTSGINVNALKGVRSELNGPYRLQIGAVERGASDTVYVVAEFTAGPWIICRVFGKTLSHCYDASPPYLMGFPALISQGELPADCLSCRVRAADAQIAWLARRFSTPGRTLVVTRQAQWGDVVLLRVTDGNESVECFMRGLAPVALDACRDSGTRR